MGLILPRVSPEEPAEAYAPVKALWCAVIQQAVNDAVATDADLFAGRGASTSASRPSAADREAARHVLTAADCAAWRRDMSTLADLAPDSLDRLGRRLASNGWTPHGHSVSPVDSDLLVEVNHDAR